VNAILSRQISAAALALGVIVGVVAWIGWPEPEVPAAVTEPEPEPRSRHDFDAVEVRPVEHRVGALRAELAEISRLRDLLQESPDPLPQPVSADDLAAAIPLVMPPADPPAEDGPDRDLEALVHEARRERAAFLTAWGRPPARPDDYAEDDVRRALEAQVRRAGGHLYAVDCVPYPCRALGIAPLGTSISAIPLDLPGATAHAEERDGATELVFLLPGDSLEDPQEVRFVRQLAISLRNRRQAAWEAALTLD